MRVRRRRRELGSKACMSGVEKGFMAQHRGNTTRLTNRSPLFPVAGDDWYIRSLNTSSALVEFVQMLHMELFQRHSILSMQKETQARLSVAYYFYQGSNYIVPKESWNSKARYSVTQQ
jgi:hypothetical protein